MPSADMTVPVLFWPLRTRAELDAAAWEIYDDVPGVVAHTMRNLDGDSNPMIYLQIVTRDVGVTDAPMGRVLVKNPGNGWEVLTVDQAVGRGLPMPPLDTDSP